MYRPVLALALFAAAAAAQNGEIRGVVSDPGARPAPAIRVELQPGGFVAQSDAGGRFAFPEVAPGLYTLTAGSADFQPVTIRGVRVGAGGQARADVRLERLRVSHMQIDVIEIGRASCRERV